MTGDPKISLVVAVAENGVIGRGGALPWHISSDLKRFRALTMGKVIIMGRNTFDSIGKPLDGRENIVVTSMSKYAMKGVWAVPTIKDAFDFGARLSEELKADEVMIIGGAQIYQSTINIADRVYLTRVHAAPDGDTYFPELDKSVWEKISEQECPKCAKDDYAHSFVVYQRISKTRNRISS